MVNMEAYLTGTLRGYVSAGTVEYLAEEVSEEIK